MQPPVSSAAAGAIFRYFDWGATFLWALSGSMRAARRGYDLTGIFATALVTACGGGLLRDAFFLQQGPPTLVKSSAYVALVAGAAFSLWLLGTRGLPWTSRLLAVLTVVADGLGLGVFTVVGMHLAQVAGVGVVGASLIGVVNAVGGALLGSAMLREPAEVLRPGHLTAAAAIAGTVVYGALVSGLHVAEGPAGAASIAVVACLHWTSLRYRFHTRPAWNLGERWNWPRTAPITHSPEGIQKS